MTSETARGGLLFVLSGPSGVGKDAVLNCLKQKDLSVHFVITATTRALRPGEVHGVDYYFAQQQEFLRLNEQGELLEWALVHGNYYGTPRGQVRQALAAGRDVMLKIDVQGAAKVRAKVPGAVLIFLAPPSVSDLIERLAARGTESVAERAVRLADAAREMEALVHFDYVVVNHRERLTETAEQVLAIMTAEHCRVRPRLVEV